MIFLDSSNIVQIERFYECGIIQGVTTNPTILRREGLQREAIRKRLLAIAALIHPYPLSIEVPTNNPTEMIQAAKNFRSYGDNIVVKIPIHGPDDYPNSIMLLTATELHQNLELIHRLEFDYDIRVNVTAMMSAQQGYLAALAGAAYASIFGGRTNNIGHDACAEITQLRYLIDQEDLATKIIVGSTREVLNVVQWLDAGAHIVTVTPDLLEKMIWHPYTSLTVQQFLNDAKE